MLIQKPDYQPVTPFVRPVSASVSLASLTRVNTGVMILGPIQRDKSILSGRIKLCDDPYANTLCQERRQTWRSDGREKTERFRDEKEVWGSAERRRRKIARESEIAGLPGLQSLSVILCVSQSILRLRRR